MALELATGRLHRLGEEGDLGRFPPCSSFKLPHTLIALGAGAVALEDSRLPWDPAREPAQDHWPASWKRDQDLRSALRDSVVWYYQELARRVGSEEMARRLATFAYGNQDLSGGIDRFWLGSSLRVSPQEQVEFLRRLFAGELEVPVEHRTLLQDSLLLETVGGHRISGKTGACPEGKGLWHGWLVGWIEPPPAEEEHGGISWIFATHLTGASYATIADERFRLSRAVLTDLGALP